jgi:flagella synthesis protein FlgN
VNYISDSLIAVLHEQIRCAEEMLGALGRENQALVDGDPELLNTTGADKARLVEALEALETERRGLTEAIEAATAAAAGPGGAPQSTAEWQTLLRLIAACKDQNQRNGALVKARSEQVRMALNALRGAEPQVYDPNGLKPSARSARRLGTA